MSDHSLIEIVVSQHRATDGTNPINLPRRWRLRDVNWDIYSETFGWTAMDVPIEDFRTLAIDSQVSQIDRWMCTVNDTLLGRCRRTRQGEVKWWTRALDSMRRNVRRLRKRFQRGRRSNAEDLAQRKADYLTALKEYKDEFVKVKEDNRGDP